MPKSGPPHRTEAPLSQIGLMLRGVAASVRHPLDATGASWRTVTHLDQVPTARSIPGTRTVGRLARRTTSTTPAGVSDGDLLDAPPMDAPRTHLNGTISPHRRFAMVSLPLDPVRELKSRH
jgi:hypothetical protein